MVVLFCYVIQVPIIEFNKWKNAYKCTRDDVYSIKRFIVHL